MTDWPRISIVTPSFNQSQFLEQTICSVLDQGYPNLEYFVMDGGSTDGSVEIIHKYAHRLTHWVSEKDHGQTHAINKGMNRTTGEILAYINSDDYYLPGAFECIAREYLNQPFDLIAGACRYVDGNGHSLGVHKGNPVSLMEFLDIHRYQGLSLSQQEVFWGRQVFEKVGQFREDLSIAFDFEYWVRAVAAGFSITHINEQLACYRLHTQQKTQQNVARGLPDEILVAKEYIQRPINNGLSRTDVARINRAIRWAKSTIYYRRAYEASQDGNFYTSLNLWIWGIVSYPSSLLDRSALRWLKQIILRNYLGKK